MDGLESRMRRRGFRRIEAVLRNWASASKAGEGRSDNQTWRPSRESQAPRANGKHARVSKIREPREFNVEETAHGQATCSCYITTAITGRGPATYSWKLTGHPRSGALDCYVVFYSLIDDLTTSDHDTKLVKTLSIVAPGLSSRTLRSRRLHDPGHCDSRLSPTERATLEKTASRRGKIHRSPKPLPQRRAELAAAGCTILAISILG